MWGPGLGTKAAICWAGRERLGGPGQHPREPRCPPGSACNWEGRKGTTLHTAELYRNIHPHNLAGRPVNIIRPILQVSHYTKIRSAPTTHQAW